MSRIEKALEKAAQLRKKENGTDSKLDQVVRSATGPDQQGEEGGPAKISHEGRPVQTLQIDHPMIFTFSDPRSPIAEEFRKLKSTLVNLARQGDLRKTVMITSSLSGEGKSVTAINLAITLAQEYDHTVLLVDADLRKPSIHKYFHLTPKVGLADCLCDGLDLSEAIIRTNIGKLSFIPAGREVENPAELLGAQRMKALVQEMRNRYPDRFVIIDTPPVLPVAETRSLSTYIDGVIFVIREGMVSPQHINDALGAIHRKKVLGVVYNHIRNESLSGRYHYYYHGY
ncbi:MAG: tyrosine-protein kinase family protein [Desulfuromonadales bacterium]|nr:tyrosine-protein kinase family protein [Desulfuromonadales bacterium]